MTKTSEFSWKQEEARGLMNKFKEFWSSNPQNYGITGGTDAATGDANAKNLFNLMLNHGSVSRKARGEGPTGGLFFGAGTVWEELEDLVADKLILEDEVKQIQASQKLKDLDQDHQLRELKRDIADKVSSAKTFVAGIAFMVTLIMGLLSKFG